MLQPPLEEAWVYNARAGFGPGSPLIVGETVLVSTRKGEVHALDRQRGKRSGRKRFGETIDGTPLVANGSLFLPVSWGRRTLHAYDLARARTRWHVKGTPIEAGVLELPDAVVVADVNGLVTAYDKEDGAVRWEQSLGAQRSVFASPVLAGPFVVLADDQGVLTALDPSQGILAWAVTLEGPVYTSPAALGEQLFVPTTRGRFYALDARDGHRQWQFALADTTVRFTAPAVWDGRVFFGGSDGVVRAVEAETGALAWTASVEAAVAAPPLVTPQAVFVGSMGKKLYAFDRHDGALLWAYELRGRVKSAMAASGTALVVLAEPRFVYLFNSTGVPHEASY